MTHKAASGKNATLGHDREGGEYYKVVKIFDGPDGKRFRQVRLRVTPIGDTKEHYFLILQTELRPNYWQDLPGEEKDLGPC